MVDICQELSSDIIKSEFFNNEYKKLCLNLAIEQIKNVGSFIPISIDKCNLQYLLKCANIFSQTNDNILKEKALRIAQFCFEHGNTTEKECAFIIVSTLTNNPSISLAKENHLLDDNIEYYLPLNLTLQKLEQENTYAYENGNTTTICNSFQKKFIDRTAKTDCKMLSISAPTSSGKSYIVLQWLIKNLELENNNQINIAIIVPTRALINQYERDLNQKLNDNIDQVHIETMPFRNGNILDKRKSIYIFTQERMSAFLAKNMDIKFKILFVDEAQKIGDGHRGVLLETIVEKIRSTASNTQIVFASPFVENPQSIYPGTEFLKDNLMTINQNFYKIERIKGKPLLWNVFIIYNENLLLLGQINLDSKIKGKSIPNTIAKFVQTLTFNNEDGNLIYANNPSDAEKIAELLYEKSYYNIEKNEEIQKLTKLCKEIVHKDFSLIKFLKRGIAFHYGSMPQLIRAKIEELFNQKTIKYLICTSTLLEGVNLSCKNIFIKNPKRSQQIKMTTPDVFNLVGRAGRLKKEFYGNIFYIDWDEAPLTKEETTVERTINRILHKNFKEILSSLNSDFSDLKIENKEHRDSLEATLGYLYTQYIKLGDIKRNKEVQEAYSLDEIKQLNEALLSYSQRIKIPKKILEKHPIVYHYSMQKLLEYFEERHPDNPKEYLVNLKDKEKMKESIFRFLNRMNRYFNTGIFGEKTTWYITFLVKHWLTFQNLSVIINLRYENYKDVDKEIKISIRKSFKDIDDYARYLIPKLLSCYIDVLNFYLEENGHKDLIYNDDDIEMLLEYGIDNKTQKSMITIGLSRATIINLFDIKTESEEYLLDNIEMDEKQVLKWLNSNISYIKSNDKIPELLIEEIDNVLFKYKSAIN